MESGSPFERPLGYVVLCRAENGGTNPAVYSPFTTEQLDEVANKDMTVPHGISRAAAAALPGLWYTLHLPSTLSDLIDTPARILKAAQQLKLDHHILLLPIDVFDARYVDGFFRGLHRTLVVCPDDLLEEARQRSKTMDFALPAMGYASLGDESLTAHWQAIHRHFVPDSEPLGNALTLTRRLDLAPVLLPHRRLARQMGWADDLAEPSLDNGADGLALRAVHGQILLATIARLESEQTSREVAEQRFESTLDEEARSLRFPLTLALPGVAVAYSRTAYSSELRSHSSPLSSEVEPNVWSVALHERSDSAVEDAAIEFAATHHAVATNGLGLMMPPVPRDAFVALAELERHFIGNENPASVRSLMARLDAAASSVWSEDVVELIKRASQLTVFSNFPLGLLTLPGDTSPLTARLPLTYRPLTPLIRTLQHETNTPSSVNLNGRVRVLIAECIPTSDPVGRLSRQGWKVAKETAQAAGDALKIDEVETLTPDALRHAVTEYRPDFLIISAHGSFRGNVAGLVIGDKLCLELGLGLGDTPPVVMLSACHVAPRGAGAVSVTDLLLREGVLAVLGTQVPVRVDRNAMLMVRFLANVVEELKHPGHFATLLDVWHHVQAGNAVNDILGASRSLQNWALKDSGSSIPVLTDFMMNRSKGRLRRGRIYEDTERVLAEIADEMGMGSKVRNWFRRPGYVPESMFYLFVGRPERIHLGHVVSRVESFRLRP
ncbi:CHAT domain-containing protein [Streptomyces sp. NBC_01411]|uniref:CHAT domain-containing protein n=1 Tax=Streptomyces sp. NBC_01411 TaxID=2903857 RepID=UPI003255E82F